MGNSPVSLLCSELVQHSELVQNAPRSSSSRVKLPAPMTESPSAKHGLEATGVDRLLPKLAPGANPFVRTPTKVNKERVKIFDSKFTASVQDEFPVLGSLDGTFNFLDDVLESLRSARHHDVASSKGDEPIEDFETAPPTSTVLTDLVPKRGKSGNIKTLQPLWGSLQMEDKPNSPSSANQNCFLQREGSQFVDLSDDAGIPALKLSSATKQMSEVQVPGVYCASVKKPAMSPRTPLPTPRELPQVGELGNDAPGLEERRWIDAALRRMFKSLGPIALEFLVEAFREWRLPRAAVIVKQATPISTGPGLCVLFDGVVDVLHLPKGGTDSEKVCTYDRCGQCFGELELFYDNGNSSRKLHWATISTRTPVVLWTVDRRALQGMMQQFDDLARPDIPEAKQTQESG